MQTRNTSASSSHSNTDVKSSKKIDKPDNKKKHVTSESDDNDSLYSNNEENTNTVTNLDCPCHKSDLKSWLLVCAKCRQTWHSNCANLRGITKTVVLALESWACPWCYTSPYPKPSHYFLESEETVIDVDGSTVYNFSSEFKKLSDSVSNTVNKSIKNVESEIAKQNKKLTDLTESLSNLQQNVHTIPSRQSSDTFAPYSNAVTQPPVEITPPEPAISNILQNFIDDDECVKLTSFLSKIDYKEEKGHGVKNYGAQYKYTGAADKTNDDIPNELMEIVGKIKNQFPDTEITEVLVNRYENGQSSLSIHSDDELDIDPESSIFCLSIGQERKIKFTEKFSGNESEHCPKTGSLYIMTHTSQAYYRHRIDPEPNCNKVHYSLTFRHVKKLFTRSTIIIGDSNSIDLKFGQGVGTFGVGLPGRRVKAATVEDINPYDCVAYSNAIFIVGTNNLRNGNIASKDDVSKVFKCFDEKIRILQKLRKDIKIIIIPVLPSRFSDMNQHIVCYNRMLFMKYIATRSSFKIKLPALYEFLDEQRLLRRDLTRDGDYIHLNTLGLSRLAKVIKDAIFNKKSNSGIGKQSPQVQGHHSQR